VKRYWRYSRFITRSFNAQHDQSETRHIKCRAYRSSRCSPSISLHSQFADTTVSRGCLHTDNNDTRITQHSRSVKSARSRLSSIGLFTLETRPRSIDRLRIDRSYRSYILNDRQTRRNRSRSRVNIGTIDSATSRLRVRFLWRHTSGYVASSLVASHVFSLVPCGRDLPTVAV